MNVVAIKRLLSFWASFIVLELITMEMGSQHVRVRVPDNRQTPFSIGCKLACCMHMEEKWLLS